jgi:hypothetical protein
MYANKKVKLTQDFVEKYCDLINDTNFIHKSEYNRPVVPGMLTTALIFEKPGDFWRLAKMDIRYSDAVYIDTEIEYVYNLLVEKNKIKKYRVSVLQEERLCLEADILLIRKN